MVRISELTAGAANREVTEHETAAGSPEVPPGTSGADRTRFEFEAALARANGSASSAFKTWEQHRRIRVGGVPPGALAYMLAQGKGMDARRGTKQGPMVVVTGTPREAERFARDLRANRPNAHEGSAILSFPAPDMSPYLEVAADRRTTMDRLSVLFHLTQNLATDALVLPAAALIRRVPPKDAIAARSTVVRPEEELDRDAFLSLLVDAGYLKTPLAEDPGTFSVRGGLIDVFSPLGGGPARIELDDWLVTSIRRFDADTQRTLEPIDEVLVHPVRNIMRTGETIAPAVSRIRELCDAVDYPTSKARKLIEDIEEGRSFYGVDHYLPAFFPEMGSILDYIPATAQLAIVEPDAVRDALSEELNSAAADLEARQAEGLPSYPLASHYVELESIDAQLASRPMLLATRGAATPVPEENRTVTSTDLLFESGELEQVELAGNDHSALAQALKNQRASQAEQTLKPLSDSIHGWRELGLRVFLATRTESQGKRLHALLRPLGLELPAPQLGEGFEGLTKLPAGALRIIIKDLSQGFVLPTDGIALITEEEIFGSRGKRRTATKRAKQTSKSFLEDLRELSVGDFVVHNEHGIGRYLGIERKSVGQSQLDRLQGKKALEVEVLVIEYASQDRLFMPVTRLAQLQKFSGKEGHAPRLDKLGGQTFTKTKSKIKKRVKQLAEELLKLYAERAAREREPLPEPGADYDAFEATFPFEETADQLRVIEEVQSDLERPKPMDRVVCGDVGFGKTEVAIRAAFRSAMAGRQVAVLCPTTVLAQQHFMTFRDRLSDYPIQVRVLSRFVEKKDQSETIAGLKDGRVDIVIGTHRLLSKDVHFKELGLLVVDEEQRFGVTHKERIKKLRAQVDVLTLSATPIPRTLQLAIGGLRDLSLITTAPTDRRAVRTFATRWNDHLVAEAIRRELTRGGQVFFVFNRIDGLHERAVRLGQLVPEARLAVAHGQLQAAALERVMTDFVEGRSDILCSTAIIESGLDIPRANTMIVDRADMFGLSQLYQLRGRVGRSRERAYCYLLTPPPSRMSDEARYRIEALERFTALGSGFHVASLDMEQRGSGELLGAEQSGAVAQIGFDMFVHMLEDAIAELRGEPVFRDIDPEMTFDAEWYLPDDYIEDVGLRLSFYKRFAEADDAAMVDELSEELEDRFGPLPAPAERFSNGMALKPRLRNIRALGVEAKSTRVTLHLKGDTPLDPAKVQGVVTSAGSPWTLTPDMRLTRKFEDPEDGKKDGIDRLKAVLDELSLLMRDN